MNKLGGWGGEAPWLRHYFIFCVEIETVASPVLVLAIEASNGEVMTGIGGNCW